MATGRYRSTGEGADGVYSDFLIGKNRSSENVLSSIPTMTPAIAITTHFRARYRISPYRPVYRRCSRMRSSSSARAPALGKRFTGSFDIAFATIRSSSGDTAALSDVSGGGSRFMTDSSVSHTFDEGK